MANTRPSVAEVEKFDHGKLKHVKTDEKNTLPSDESKDTFLTLLHAASLRIWYASQPACW